MDETDKRIDGSLRIFAFDIGLISHIRLMGHISDPSDSDDSWVIFPPDSESSLAQKILEVFE